ncbi:MAG: CoA transferase [Alphaproteobacteria bacterium]|jgi:crotonobetainyl-CoA:carnitine CoA-transferase CaiB-like acyl-CoA transferase|nr:CoA transferase [Alphaproteobacteria bacterium]MBT5159527.1 CoA transferase [Alphaproteobacteria bacterium]MBT6385629.1 CoA transferase [Alphaproteobacteria bacterium]
MSIETQPQKQSLPLAGIRVLELGHVVMGACCGLVLADMGAEVIKVERAPEGDDTRRFGGFGQGLFHFFNRNKKSLAIDLKSDAGKAVFRRALENTDVLIENFGPGAVERLGFGYEACKEINPGLVYCSLKGFMPGPYEHRPSLDNLVQMMGGLAYMTGPTGQPLRAGASVTDILGATYGALGVVAALRERDQTGLGQNVRASLFEATSFLVGQHMSTAAITDAPVPPMPEGENPWTVYELFTTADGDQVCIGIISDKHWAALYREMKLGLLAADDRFTLENGRREHKDEVLGSLQKEVAARSTKEVLAACDAARIPFAPVNRPDELADDPHLNQSGALVETVLPDGRTAKLPKLPLQMKDQGFDLRHEPPTIGQGGADFLRIIGLSDQEIEDLFEQQVIVEK